MIKSFRQRTGGAQVKFAKESGWRGVTRVIQWPAMIALLAILGMGLDTLQADINKWTNVGPGSSVLEAAVLKSAEYFLTATGYSSQIWATNDTRRVTRLSVVTDSAACTNITAAPYEYFYQAGMLTSGFREAFPTSRALGAFWSKRLPPGHSLWKI
jgi:hypothetical protein